MKELFGVEVIREWGRLVVGFATRDGFVQRVTMVDGHRFGSGRHGRSAGERQDKLREN
jgi:hypothetical protein